MPRLNLPKAEEWPSPTLAQVRGACEAAYLSTPKGWIGQRDAALIAVVATFGKRCVEVAKMKASDIRVTDDRLYARFSVAKRHQVKKVRCKRCGTINRLGWKFCRQCGTSLQGLEEQKWTPQFEYVTKNRSLTYPLVPFITDWHSRLLGIWKRSKVPPEAVWLFPPSKTPGILGVSSVPDLTNHVGRQSVYRQMKKWAPSWWPHLLRHSLAVRFSEEGYDKADLDDWFDWSPNSQTAFRYLKMGGGKRIRRMGESKA